MKYLNDIIRVSNYSTTDCQRDESKLRDLLNVYLKVFEENLKTSCGNCIGDSIIRLQIELRKYNLTNKIKQEIMSKEKREYVMKPGSVIDMVFSTGEYHTPDNMTDAKARKLISRNPAYFKLFIKYPKDEVDKILDKRTDAEKEAEKIATEKAADEKKEKEEATGKMTPQKDEKPDTVEKKVATPDSIDALVKDNSKDALLEKAKGIPGVNAETDKATIAKMILEA